MFAWVAQLGLERHPAGSCKSESRKLDQFDKHLTGDVGRSTPTDRTRYEMKVGSSNLPPGFFSFSWLCD